MDSVMKREIFNDSRTVDLAILVRSVEDTDSERPTGGCRGLVGKWEKSELRGGQPQRSS